MSKEQTKMVEIYLGLSKAELNCLADAVWRQRIMLKGSRSDGAEAKIEELEKLFKRLQAYKTPSPWGQVL